MMTGYLLDTNCISELVRLRPEPRLVQWIDAADEGLLYLSVLTLGQIHRFDRFGSRPAVVSRNAGGFLNAQVLALNPWQD